MDHDPVITRSGPGGIASAFKKVNMLRAGAVLAGAGAGLLIEKGPGGVLAGAAVGGAAACSIEYAVKQVGFAIIRSFVDK